GTSNYLAWAPDSRSLAASHDATMDVWDVTAGRRLHTLQVKAWVIDSVAWSPDGKTLAAGARRGEGGKVHGWDAKSGDLLDTLDSGAVAAYSPDGKTLAAVSLDCKTLRLWDTAQAKLLRTLKVPATDALRPISLAWSPDGKLLALGTLEQGSV